MSYDDNYFDSSYDDDRYESDYHEEAQDFEYELEIDEGDAGIVLAYVEVDGNDCQGLRVFTATRTVDTDETYQERIKAWGPAERAAADESPATLTPRAVNELVRGALTRHIPATLHVLGEIGDLSRPQSGPLYFSLKDPYSELRCVMWRSTAAKLKFVPEAGMEVIATGGLEVYTPRGTYQLIARRLEPRGKSSLAPGRFRSAG